MDLVNHPNRFESLALEVFKYQSLENQVYERFLTLVGFDFEGPLSIENIPFLPISFFKTQKVISNPFVPTTFFESSGTSGQVRSRHWMADLNHYHQVSTEIFDQTFGSPSQYFFIGLLPTYLENSHSSLIEMVRNLGKQGGREAIFSGLDFETFSNAFDEGKKSGRIIFIFGVTYAFLKMLEPLSSLDLDGAILVETGGMKGLEMESPKEAVKELLKERLKVKNLFSEYGMTEMQSQAYGSDLEYKCSFTMKVMVRQLENPLESLSKKGRGALNIIDLANWQSCSFLATDDVGEVLENGNFLVHGRVENSDIRGCNLLFANV